MKLFGKKRSKEEDIDEEDELVPEDTEISKSSKPVRKRKKKEKPKEWGKRERIIVLVVLIITVSLSGILALMARNWKLPGIPRIQIPDVPSISLLQEEIIYLEPNKENLTKKEMIEENFDVLTRDLSGVYGLYVVNLSDGFSVGINAEEEFEPASFGKLPVMMASYREADAGRLNLREEYVLKETDKIGGSGTLSSKSEGTLITYQAMLSLMGKESDNTSFGILRETLGMDVIDKVIAEIGMSQTSLTENTTTPKDIGVLFDRLYRNSYLTSESANLLLTSLTDTIYESWIPAGLPTEIRVAHKFGREVHVVNDAGIVYADDPYVIVIMSKGIIEKEADNTIPLISKMVYEVLENN